jgi:hypothetical protein
MNIETTLDKRRGAARQYYYTPSYVKHMDVLYDDVIISRHVNYSKPKHNRPL